MNIIGHTKILKLLDKAITKNSVSHAYLFYGPDQVGKFTVALDFANKLLGDSSQINPDLIIVKPEIEEKKGVSKKHDIKIEEIRELQHKLSLSSQSGKHKIAIIDESDRLNKIAQNALLKSLEEAKAGVVLILVSSDEKKILPTMISRCQKVRFGAVPEKEMREELKSESKEKTEEIIFWSLGRPGLMMELKSNEEEFDSRGEIKKELTDLFGKNISERFLLAEAMAKDGELLEKKLNLWLILLREAILGTGKFKLGPGKALSLAGHIEKDLEILKNTNSNAKLVLENLFLQF